MNYTYINSQIKVIEEKILNRNDFLKLIKTPKSDFLKTLIDLGYGSNITSLERIINEELNNVKKYLDEVSPKREYTDLFFLVNDAINIKYLYKLKVFHVRDAQMFLKRGNLLEEDLRNAILEHDYSNLSKDYKKLLKNIAANVSGISNSRTLSGVIDATIYEFILSKIKLSFSEPLNIYFKSQIDFSNLLSYVRIKNLKWNYTENKEMFIDGGNIPLSKIESLFTLKNDDVIRSMNEFYDEKLSMILNDYYKSNNLNTLEIKLDNLQLEIMRKFKDDSFGIGIIMYYYLKKLAEAKNIRYIYANQDLDLDNLLDY